MKMKWLVALIAVFSVIKIWAEEPTRKWYGDFQSQLFVVPGNGDVYVAPKIGVGYNYHHLFNPAFHMGIMFGGEEQFFLNSDVSVKSKLSEDKIWYWKSSIKTLRDLKDYGVHVCEASRWSIFPEASVGVNIDDNKYYEFGVSINPYLISKFSFSISSGIQF